MQFRRKRRAAVDIGLIPMIDVLLVLLFFFMLATTFRQHTDLKIQLPSAGGAASPKSPAVNLFIDAAGEYALSTPEEDKARPVSPPSGPGLRAALAQMPAGWRDAPFIINADAKTPHQAVITALEAAGQSGFVQITFATRPEAGGVQ